MAFNPPSRTEKTLQEQSDEATITSMVAEKEKDDEVDEEEDDTKMQQIEEKKMQIEEAEKKVMVLKAAREVLEKGSKGTVKEKKAEKEEVEEEKAAAVPVCPVHRPQVNMPLPVLDGLLLEAQPPRIDSEMDFSKIFVDSIGKQNMNFGLFLTTAISDKSSPEWRSLHNFLLNCFVSADMDFDGLIGILEIDALLDSAVAIPRLYGFAPVASELYSNKHQQQSCRFAKFNEIAGVKDATKINFPQWLAWCTKHIAEKVVEDPSVF